MTDPRTSPIRSFLATLEGYAARDDRGPLANLRRGFSETTEHRAWPYIAGWCRLDNERDRRIWLTIGAGFATCGATHPGFGNLGRTLRRLALGTESGRPAGDALRSFEARFRRLLTCATAVDLTVRLPGVIRAAAGKGVPIDFEQLFWDLVRWHEPDRRARLRWADAYWSPASTEPSKGGDAP